ncbi:MAG: VanZ family protein [Pirellulales bacterium]|nr:VanZ family protein [Pirellulales bacterium]
MHKPATENTSTEKTNKMPKAAFVIPLVLAVILVVGLVVPIPLLSRSFGVFFDVMHGPAFALFAAILVHMLLRWTQLKRLPIVMGVWIFLTGSGILTEILQSFIGRTASWHDIEANTLGVTAGVLWTSTRNVDSRRLRGWCTAVSILLILIPAVNVPFVLTDCIIQQRDWPMLASFERQLELIRWKVLDTRIARTSEHVTHGKSSLRVEFDKTDNPTIASGSLPNNWAGEKELAFDVTIDNGPEVELLVKVFDVDHKCGDPTNDFEKIFRLEPGTHEIEIPLVDVANGPAGRKLDLSRITELQFILINPDRPRVLYFDNIRLN